MTPMQLVVTVPAQAFLTYDEAAVFLSVSVDYVRDSDCPRCQLGSRVVFFVGDLLRFGLDRRRPQLDRDSTIELRIEPKAAA